MPRLSLPPSTFFVLVFSASFLGAAAYDVLFFDDLLHMFRYEDMPFFEYFNSKYVSSVPFYHLIFKIFRGISSPVVIRVITILVMLLGLVGLKRVLTRLNVSDDVSYVCVSLCALSYFSAEPIYFISAFGQHFSWAATVWMCFIVLHMLQKHQTRSLYLLGVFVLYWAAAFINAQNALIPFAFGALLLVPVYRSKRNAYLLAIVFSLTSVPFLIRKFVFSVEYHINELGWVSYGPSEVISRLSRYAHSLIEIEPSFVAADFLLVGSMVGTFLLIEKESFSKKSSVTGEFYAFFSALFFFSVITVLLIKHSPARYFFSPTVFLLSMLVVVLYARLDRKLFKVAIVALLSLLGVQRVGFIDENFKPLKQAYFDFANQHLQILASLPDYSQFLILNHPIHKLTRGYHHWSTRLAWQLTGNRTLSGIFGDTGYPSDLITDHHWASKDGISFRKRNAGLNAERKTFVYLFDSDGGVFREIQAIDVEGDEPKHFIVDKANRLLQTGGGGWIELSNNSIRLKSYEKEISDIEYRAILQYP